jgi:glycosyltransferase involved in cell wall biosynthesis
MKIAHIINSLDNGGAEAVLVRLVSHKTNDTHVIISLSPPAWYSATLVKSGVEVHHLDGTSPATLVVKLVNLLLRIKPDIVQTWMYRSNVIGGIASNISRIPVVWGIHCTPTDNRFSLQSRAMIHTSGVIARFCPTGIVSCSEKGAGAHERLGYPSSKTLIVHNGFDTDAFTRNEVARCSIRSEFGISEDVFLIGTVARWHCQKDHPNLFEALRILDSRQNKNWKCLLVGTGMNQQNSELQGGLVAANVVDRVILSEARRDVASIMAALDVHVLPSAFGEAFPNVVAEAMACGTPCIVTNVGDSAIMVGDTGWVVSPGAPGELAETIECAIDEQNGAPDLWNARSRGARNRIAMNFTIDHMYLKYRAAWERFLECRAS